MDDDARTREPQYQDQIELLRAKGLTKLGLMTNQVYHDDPRRLVFILARYKFVAKMLSGRKRILEVGAGDAFATRIVLQEVGSLQAVDFDPVFVRDAEDRMEDRWRFDVKVHDMTADGPVEPRDFDGAYCIDVLEHVPPDKAGLFMDNLTASLVPEAALIVGVPSLASQEHASPQSRAGHVNCMDHETLKSLMERSFRHVFLFSMHDEVVHTGFYPMANYLLALCCQKR
jgi:2-polyprenyl-3-methyl-5-hydroxy-6-metoxy-1,4-benzoquinol methylase